MLDAGLFIGKESLDYFKALIIALAKLKEIEQLDCKFNIYNPTADDFLFPNFSFSNPLALLISFLMPKVFQLFSCNKLKKLQVFERNRLAH